MPYPGYWKRTEAPRLETSNLKRNPGHRILEGPAKELHAQLQQHRGQHDDDEDEVDVLAGDRGLRWASSL